MEDVRHDTPPGALENVSRVSPFLVHLYRLCCPMPPTFLLIFFFPLLVLDVGLVGSLHLHRGGLSPPTSCRRNRHLSGIGTRQASSWVSSCMVLPGRCAVT